MQALIDYAVAVVVGGVILLILLSIEFRGQQTTVDAVQFESAKKGLFSFVEMMERDFRNIGAQFPNHPLPVADAITDFDTSATVSVFAFRGQTVPDSLPQLIQYEWEEIAGKTAMVDGAAVPLLEIRRLVDGTLTGRSTGMVTRFAIHLHRDECETVPVIFNLEDTRRVEVNLRAVSPLGPGELVEEVAFDGSYSPVAMTRVKPPC